MYKRQWYKRPVKTGCRPTHCRNKGKGEGAVFSAAARLFCCCEVQGAVSYTHLTVVPLIIVVYYALTDGNGNFTIANLTSVSGYGSVFARSLLLALVATAVSYTHLIRLLPH